MDLQHTSSPSGKNDLLSEDAERFPDEVTNGVVVYLGDFEDVTDEAFLTEEGLAPSPEDLLMIAEEDAA